MFNFIAFFVAEFGSTRCYKIDPKGGIAIESSASVMD
jgi:hypothetical protein